jgi:hypothetical protein
MFAVIRSQYLQEMYGKALRSKWLRLSRTIVRFQQMVTTAPGWRYVEYAAHPIGSCL